jgi:hypothetical protein
MKPKTAEKSDSTHPKRQNESTRERVLEAAFTLLCEHGLSEPSHKALAKNLSQKLTKQTKEGPLRATSLNAKTIHPFVAFVISCKKDFRNSTFANIEAFN